MISTGSVHALFFAPTMPPDKAQARYRALSKVLHPDTATGDTQLMQRLNVEFEAFERGILLPAPPEPSATPADSLSSYFDAVCRKARLEIAGLPRLPGVSYEVDTLNRQILAVGQSYDHREVLKVHDFRWDRERRVWAKKVYL